MEIKNQHKRNVYSLGFSVLFAGLIVAQLISLWKLEGPLEFDITGYQLATIAFFAGVILVALLDKLIDSRHGNPHEIHDPEEMDQGTEIKKQKLLRMGLFTALATATHNFPEGLATFL